jgi:hypothetical protein
MLQYGQVRGGDIPLTLSARVDEVVKAGGPRIDIDINNLTPAIAATKKAIYNVNLYHKMPVDVIDALLQQQEDLGQCSGFDSVAERHHLSASPYGLANREAERAKSPKKAIFTMPEAAPEE